MKLPGWPPRDGRAFIALLASIAGSAVLTGFSMWVVTILRGIPLNTQTAPLIIKALANSNYILLAIIGAVLLSLGLAINRRTLKLGRDGFEASGGDDAAQGAQATALAAVEKADEISQEQKP